MKLYIAHDGEKQDAETGEPWWIAPYGRWRLSAEREAMRERFPAFELCLTRDNQLAWRGRLTSGLDPSSHYLVEISYPDRFPDAAPDVAILEPEIVWGTPHFLFGRKPCLYRWDGRQGYEPARTTAATLVAWTALWIHAYETWRATGVWPGTEE